MNKKKNILVVFGTRPEVIKLAPVIMELKKNPQYNVIVCNTEQQKELSNQTLEYFGLKADINLDCMRPNQSLADIQARIINSLEHEVFSKYETDATIIQGDTMTVLCAALTSYYRKIPVFYVEAGLRSYNIYEPFPEEIMRQMASRVTELHFAPTLKNKEALLKEGIGENKIYVTGNTVTDALFCLSSKTLENAKAFFEEKNIKINDKIILITAHRRENHGERIDHIIKAIKDLAEKYTDHSFIIPVHPNPNVREKIFANLDSYPNIHLLEPLDYPNLVYIMKNAKLILTDSGGIQEEAPTFGCPTLVMRYETERQEGIDAGVSVLVGADYDKIIKYSSGILDKDFKSTRLKTQNPYGNGTSAKQIKEIIDKYFQ